MRRTTRVLAGAALAAGLGLTGCGEDDTPDLDEGVTSEEFVEPDDGAEDPDSVDPGTGGIQDDEDTDVDTDD